MKYRIAIWATAGFLVAAGWAAYFFIRGPVPFTSAEPIKWALASWTCPIALASFHLHFGVSYHWAILANAVTYALAGLFVEATRWQIRHSR
jgi:hypothetical protein